MLRPTWVGLSRPFKVLRASANLPHFDVCVIGGGPAGIAAALRAVDYKKKVCIIEANRIGGCDLWNGALQSKTLWEISKFVSRVTGPLALRVFDPEQVAHLQDQVCDDRIHAALVNAAETKERQILLALEKAGVTLIFGKAMFASPHEVDVHSIGTGEYRTLASDYFVIATGSIPRPHPHYAVDKKRIITSDQMMMIPIPASMVIIGAGVVGCEFASIYANIGKTKVFLLDKAPRILPMEDEDIAIRVQDMLEARGVTIHHDSVLFDLQSFDESEKVGSCQYTIQYRGTNKLESYEVERALVSVGRVSNYKGLGLENTKCKVTDKKLEVDPFNRCLPHKHIYAVGDASVDVALLSIGEEQGRGAIDHMYNSKQEVASASVLLKNVSTVMFLDETVAAVGLNEQQCREKNVSYTMARYGYEFLSRAIAMGETTGFCKLIVTNGREKRILGVRAVGPHAGSVVEIVSLAIRQNQSAYDLLNLTVAYPTVMQGLVECIRMVLGRSLLKPNVFPQFVLKTWIPPNFTRGRAFQEIEEHRTATDKKLEASRRYIDGQHKENVDLAWQHGKEVGRVVAEEVDSVEIHEIVLQDVSSMDAKPEGD